MATRRGVLVAAGGVLLGAGSFAASRDGEKQAGGAPPGDVPKGTFRLGADAQVPRRELGRTGERVSIIGLGGYHLGMPEEVEATRIVHRALDHGLNFFDNCWDYHKGDSERRLGKALSGGLRQKAFVMTKLDAHTADATNKQLDQSLQRLQTDVIDLVQIHENIRMTDADEVFAAGGAVEALVAAKKAGKLRFIGFTGHKDPSIHLHMLDVARKNGFRFDTVQMPLNVLDAHYKSFEREVVPVALHDGTAVLGMKAMAAGLILQSGAAGADECLRYAMSVPGIGVTITGCDSEGILEQALSIAASFRPMADEERQKLLARTAPFAKDGRWEKFKTTQVFDGTEANKHWLTDAKA